MRFTKMQGAGNDYIYLDAFQERIDDPGALAVRLSDRHFGVGGDGVILVCPSDVADVSMRMFNADGSEGAMCGNGVRCVGKFAHDRGYAKGDRVTVETRSGVKTLTLQTRNGTVTGATVDMGKPELSPCRIPMTVPGDRFVDQPVCVAGQSHRATAVSMGNPHWVFFVDDVDALDLPALGPVFERDARFPDRVNTEFIQLTAQNRLKMRVWERGSGETLACGTGACAAVAAAFLCQKTGREATVDLRGGTLFIRWEQSDGHIYLTGDAVEVFSGECNVEENR